jgi:hypothetical protein
MNVQLIYKTERPESVRWFHTLVDAQAILETEWNRVSTDLGAAFRTPNGSPRELRVRAGLVGGFLPEAGERAPDGWVFDNAWGGFIPDVSTDNGLFWQTRFDDLPGHEGHDSIEIGMPSTIQVTQEGTELASITSTMHLPEDNMSVYALWTDREVKPVIDKVLETNDGGWAEVPRSVWFAMLEAYEAAAGQ